MLKKVLENCGLALRKDYALADTMWVSALNHCSHYLLDKKTPMTTIKNLTKLLILIDPDGEELINDWISDWKNKVGKKDYLARLNVICPIIIKEQKKLEKELENDANN